MEDPDVACRKALLGWLANRVDQDLPKAPEFLWHYTAANGLLGILSSDQLWATNTRFLNDSQEIAYGTDQAIGALATHNLDGRKPETCRFVRGLGDPSKPIIRDFLDRTLEVFVACFCSKGDLLSQWRAYAGQDSAGGYAIGFQLPGALPAWALSAPGGHGFALRRVLYNQAEQEKTLHDLIQRMVGLLDVDPSDIERQNAFGKNLVDGLVEAATWCKHPAFEEEQEWRIVYVRNNDLNPLQIKHRINRGLVVPYVELTVPKRVGTNHEYLPVARINCGPGPDPELKQLGLHDWLKQKPHLAHVAVTGSPAPLRL